MKTTKFYEAAELISRDIDYEYGSCGALTMMDGKLYRQDSISAKYFDDIFHPSTQEMYEYGLSPIYWMRPRHCYDIVDVNEFRILALLLCHEIYLSEQK